MFGMTAYYLGAAMIVAFGFLGSAVILMGAVQLAAWVAAVWLNRAGALAHNLRDMRRWRAARCPREPMCACRPDESATD